MRLAARLLLGALLAPPASATAQTQTPPPVVFPAEVDVVSVTVVVHDKAGRFIEGLGPKDIEVFEDGVRQEVTYFRAATGGEDKIPLSVVLVLDASGSMTPNMRFLQEAAGVFVHKLEEGVDQAMVVQFNESVKGSAEFTGDIERLDQYVESLQAWGGTALHDAIQYALSRVRDEPGRKALLVFSDGADHHSSINESEVVDYARSVEATIYAIGFRGMERAGLLARSPRGFLRRIAGETGGRFFFPERIGELVKIFADISEELHNHYALAYTPKRSPDGSWREIKVKLTREDLKSAELRVRKGYFAVRRRPTRK